MKIIAEVGSNWKTYDDLYKSCELAKEDGADAVKFQYFTSKELYGKGVKSVDEYAVPLEVLQATKEHADKAGIEFMCTAFSWAGYKAIDELVKCHKIASSESNWDALVLSVIEMDKPIYLSTGGLSYTKISRYVAGALKRYSDLTLMYCDPTYPSAQTRMAIRDGIDRLIGYGVNVGFSDHTTSHWAGELSFISTLGKLSAFEKHYNPFGYIDTPDAPHSLNRDNFKLFTGNMEIISKEHSSVTKNPHMRQEFENGWYRPLL